MDFRAVGHAAGVGVALEDVVPRIEVVVADVEAARDEAADVDAQRRGEQDAVRVDEEDLAVRGQGTEDPEPSLPRTRLSAMAEALGCWKCTP